MKSWFLKQPLRVLAGVIVVLVGSLLLFVGAKAAGGNLLWEDQVNMAGADIAIALAAQGRRVITTGFVGVDASCDSGPFAGNCDFYTRALGLVKQ